MSIGVGEERLLAEGPVAKVYAGRLAGADVAVKVFDGVLDRDTAARFDRERKALAGVRGERAILPVDETGELPGGRFGVRMELCQRSLAQLLDGQLPVRDVLAVGWTVSAALAAAHQVGVVHGGVTPHNVLLRRSGELALADFGLALRHRFPRDPLHAVDYAAPETLRDDTLSEASDLYGLGAVLYTALTGSSPFPRRTGQQRAERILQVFRDPVPPIRVPAAPPALTDLIGRLLAKDPADRPQDPAAVAETLERLYQASAAPAEVEFDDFAGHGQAPPDFRGMPQAAGFGWAPQRPGGWSGAAPQPSGLGGPQQPGALPGGVVPLPYPPAGPGGVVPQPFGLGTSAQSEGSFPGAPGHSGTVSAPHRLGDPNGAAQHQSVGSSPVPQHPGDFPAPHHSGNPNGATQHEPVGSSAAPQHPGDLRYPPTGPSGAVPQPLGLGTAPQPPDGSFAGAPQQSGSFPAPHPGGLNDGPQHEPLGSTAAALHPGDFRTPQNLGAPNGAPQHQPLDSNAAPQHLGDFRTPTDPNGLPQHQPLGPTAAPPGAFPTTPEPARIPGSGRTLLATFDDAKQPRRGRKLPRIAWWPALAAGAAAAVGAVIVVPMLTSPRDPRPALPLATAPSSGQLPPAERAPVPDVHLALAAPADLGTQIKLTWTAEGNLDFAVVVGAERLAPMVLVAHRNRTMAVPVDPARKYCFQIRATDGSHVYETPPVPVRGAVCTS